MLGGAWQALPSSPSWLCASGYPSRLGTTGGDLRGHGLIACWASWSWGAVLASSCGVGFLHGLSAMDSGFEAQGGDAV